MRLSSLAIGCKLLGDADGSCERDGVGHHAGQHNAAVGGSDLKLPSGHATAQLLTQSLHVVADFHLDDGDQLLVGIEHRQMREPNLLSDDVDGFVRQWHHVGNPWTGDERLTERLVQP